MNVFDKLAASSEDHVGVSREGLTDVRPTKIMGKNDHDEKVGIAKNVEGRRIAFGSFQGQQPVVIFNDTGKSVLITKNQVINVGFLAYQIKIPEAEEGAQSVHYKLECFYADFEGTTGEAEVQETRTFWSESTDYLAQQIESKGAPFEILDRSRSIFYRLSKDDTRLLLYSTDEGVTERFLAMLEGVCQLTTAA